MAVLKLAKLFGIVFILIGILGFVPGITTDGHLLGVFEVDTLHNVIHLLTGILAWFAAASLSNSKLFFKVFGVVYLLVTILGFTQGGSILGLFMTNMADNILHLVITGVALWAGFMSRE
jgi:hypothetical protein